MKCHICDATLGKKEIQWNTDHEDWEPCTRCLEAIDDVFDDLTEEEIDELLEFEWSELFPDFFQEDNDEEEKSA